MFIFYLQLFPPPPPPPLTSSASLMSSPSSPLILTSSCGNSDRGESFDGLSRGTAPSHFSKARSSVSSGRSSPGLVAPSPIFLGHPPLLSLIADRTHDFWAKSFANNNLLAPTTRLFPPPPPLFPFAAAAAANAPEAPTLPLTLTPNWETLQETSARLLFMAVRWVKCLAPFQTLSVRDQVSSLFTLLSLSLPYPKYRQIINGHISPFSCFSLFLRQKSGIQDVS